MNAIQPHARANLSNVASVRAAAAKRINALSNDLARNALEMGGEFQRVGDTFDEVAGGRRPGWHEWIGSETGLSVGWVNKVIAIYERFGTYAPGRTLPSLSVLTVISSE